MTEENRRLVRRALSEIYRDGNLDLANELVHSEFVDHEPSHPGLPTGPERQADGAVTPERFR